MRKTGDEYYQAIAERIPPEERAALVEQIEALEMFSGPFTREDVGPLFAAWWNYVEMGRPSMDINCSQCRITVLNHFRRMKKYLK